MTGGEQLIIDEAWKKRNPSVFLDYFVRHDDGYEVHPGSVRHKLYEQAWREQDKPKVFLAESSEITFEVGHYWKESNRLVFVEKRGYCLLPWQLDFWRAPQQGKTIIGTPGVGKSSSIGMMAMFMCATIPNFAFLGVAPRDFQSSQMVRAIKETILGTRFEKVFIKKVIEKPFAKITFHNGSTAEFMNVQKNASNVQSWYGDWVNVDEAGNEPMDQIDESGDEKLSTILIGLATRMRATRPDGTPRLRWLSLVSMAYDCDTLWQIYDMGEKEGFKNAYYSRTVTFKDNPYLTPSDIEFHTRYIPPGQEAQWLEGKRPGKRGAEFSKEMIEAMFVGRDQSSEAEIFFGHGGLLVNYLEPYKPGHSYVLAGDPGQGVPPYRNAPVCVMFDVTSFPRVPAELVGFWWGYGNGSIVPFINKFDEWMHRYRVLPYFRGYDSTSTQKAIAELAWQTDEERVVPLGFDGVKKWEYINAAKILMSKHLVKSPPIPGLEKQLRDYALPDKKLQQDLVSAFCMACHLMMPLYKEVYPDEEDDISPEGQNRWFAQITGRSYRPARSRHFGRAR